MIASGPSSVGGNPFTLLHLAPHPDDEVTGGPTIMLELPGERSSDHQRRLRPGRPEDREPARRSSASCRRAGFELVIVAAIADLIEEEIHAGDPAGAAAPQSRKRSCP